MRPNARIPTLLGPALAPALALVIAPPLGAEAADTRLTIDSTTTLRLDRAIARIEIDHDGIIAVKAPTARSLTIKGIGAGDAQLSVYATDGTLIRGGAIHVAAASPDAGGDDRLGKGVAFRANEQVVAVDVQFAAVSTSTLKALGFNFSKLSGGVQGAVVSPASLGNFSFQQAGTASGGSAGSTSLTAVPAFVLSQTSPLASAFNLFLASPNRGIGAVLSALSSNGLSQMLAEPTLLVRSGETATFLAGGEVPIPIPQSNGGTTNAIAIEFKKFGVQLTISPVVLSRDRIVLKIAPEVSELDYSNGVQLQGYTVPGIRRRSAETTVQLGSGQSFVIAGLTYTNSSISKDKVPGLGDLPVLGAFFKRQQNQRERQELIIVATPRLVGPVEAGTLPPLPGTATANLDPSIGDMILGTDGIEKKARPFGVVRR